VTPQVSALRSQDTLEKHGQAGAPIVVVTDHAILRQFLAQGIIANVRAYKVWCGVLSSARMWCWALHSARLLARTLYLTTASNWLADRSHAALLPLVCH
jgi:hypothetical protein